MNTENIPSGNLPVKQDMDLIEQAQAKPEEDLDQGTEVLAFTLGGDLYAMDILYVQEIVDVPPVSKVPYAGPHVLGIINLRGSVAPLYDLRIKAGFTVDEDSPGVAVILRVDEKVLGAVVDGVSDVLQIREEDMQTPPEMSREADNSRFKGFFTHEDKMVRLVEPKLLLDWE